jgi:hypothetical protein
MAPNLLSARGARATKASRIRREYIAMIDRKILSAGLATLVVTLSGCPSPSIPLDQLSSRLASAQCDFANRCGVSLDGLESAVREEITDCPAQLTVFVDANLLGQVRAAIGEGSIRYHAELAGACIASFEGVACGGVPSSVACSDVFEGTIADGAPCSIDEQCGAQSTCDSSSIGMCPAGVCVHVPQLGEACLATSTCANGARCASGTCVAALEAGEACSPSTGGCDIGLGCVPSAADPSTGTCTASTPAGVGERCGVCQTGLVCSSTTSTCRQPRTDGTCERTSFGADDCPSGEACVTDGGAVEGQCEPLPSVGEACTSVCARGSRCTPTGAGTSTCSVAVANGEACETDFACISGFCGSGVCAPQPVCRES